MTSIVPPKLAEYKFSIRSFHPEKTFGWSGLMFVGDDRGFSLHPSGLTGVTSRIWHTLSLNTHNSTISRITKSDNSKAPWSNDSHHYEEEFQPRHELSRFEKNLDNKVKRFLIKGGYWGVNHAMPYSQELEKNFNVSYVPSLNVNYEIRMDVDLENSHIDLVVYISGDGFPNCEAYIEGPDGKKVFLGVHVRKGVAPVTLALNLDYPMIAAALRLPINSNGAFIGKVGDELERVRNKRQNISYERIEDWNARYITMNPNNGRCMFAEDFSLEGCF